MVDTKMHNWSPSKKHPASPTKAKAAMLGMAGLHFEPIRKPRGDLDKDTFRIYRKMVSYAEGFGCALY